MKKTSADSEMKEAILRSNRKVVSTSWRHKREKEQDRIFNERNRMGRRNSS
jgi:hypothetical protein